MEALLKTGKWYGSSWFPTYNSILFLVFGFLLLHFYSFVHWDILFKNNVAIEESIRPSLHRLLFQLTAYKICGFIALLFSVFGCLRKSLIGINILLAITSCFLIIIEM